MTFSIFHQIPLWVDFLIFLTVLLTALEVGFRIGLLRRKNWQEMEQAGGRISLTSMFAVLGLMLAFTFNASITRHEARKKSVVAEANALASAFRHAMLAQEPAGTNLRETLLNYARTRTGDHSKAMTIERLAEQVRQSQEAKAMLWPAVERLVQEQPTDRHTKGVTDAINDVLKSDTVRMAAIFDSLPPVVITLLLLIASATVSVAGFNAGLCGQISRFRTSLLILVLASIMLVVLDFDRSLTGLVHVSHDSIHATISEMEESQ